MPKFLEITPQIKARIEESLGEEIDVSNFAVYEARAVSTEPLSKNKGFFARARISSGTLVQMAEFVNTEGSVLPLMIAHVTRGMLPSGRAFEAEASDLPNGEVELRVLFYIPRNSKRKIGLIADIESGLISEVSIGLLTTHAFCSECGFDFFGEEADFMNFIEQTCDNDHTIGVEGVHLRLVGMDLFAELSLVGRGAAKDAKIFSRAKSRMTEETVKRLAASGVPAEAFVLTASCKMDDKRSKPTTKEGESKMSGLEDKFVEVSEELGEKKAELSIASDTIEGLNTEREALEAKLEEANSKIAKLEDDEGEDITEVKAALDAAEKSVKEATAKLAEHVKAALVASNDSEITIPEDLEAMLALIEDKGLKLHQIVGSGAQSDGKPTDIEAAAAADEVAEARRKQNFKL